MRLSLMKAAHEGVGGAPCRKSGYMGRKLRAKPHQTISLYQTAGKGLRKNFPQKENPEEYGLQSLRENSNVLKGTAFRPYV